MKFSRSLFDELWSGEKSTCLFICLGQCFWVVDYKYNFCLDAEKDYRAYLDKGHITKNQYLSACKEFRGGVLKLTSDNFMQYIGSEEVLVLSQKETRSMFVTGLDTGGPLYERIERHYLSGTELSVDDFKVANTLVSRLPMFYVNFDREIYMHMDSGRGHEDLAYPHWLAKCGDFGYLIPDKEKYWVIDSNDFWRFRFL